MGVFDDNPFVSVKPGAPSQAAAPAADVVAQGSFWSLRLGPDGHVLEYVSGELAGRDRRLAISADEARTLKSGDDAAALAVLTAHGVG